MNDATPPPTISIHLAVLSAFPFLPLSFAFPPWPFPSSFPIPLPQTQLESLGSAVSSPSGARDRAPAANTLWRIYGLKTHLMATPAFPYSDVHPGSWWRDCLVNGIVSVTLWPLITCMSIMAIDWISFCILRHAVYNANNWSSVKNPHNSLIDTESPMLTCSLKACPHWRLHV